MAAQLNRPENFARTLREAARVWQAAKAAGTAREPDRPRTLFPGGHERPVGDLIMAIAVAMEFLDERGFTIAQVFSDYNEDRIVWTSDSIALEIGLSSGPIVMLCPLVDGDVPPFDLNTYRHAHQLVPAEVARTLPQLELEPGEQDITRALPACAAWASAALDVIAAEGWPS